MVIDFLAASQRESRNVFGTAGFFPKEPKSPCFLVGDRFFKFFGQHQIFAWFWTGIDKQDVRKFDIRTENGYVTRGFMRRGEHFNVGSMHDHQDLFTDLLITSYMTQEQVDECSREYIRIPRNTLYGYEIQFDHDKKDFGDTFLGSAPKMVKRYPPKEFNMFYNREPLKVKKVPTFAETYDPEKKAQRQKWLDEEAERNKLKQQQKTDKENSN